MSSAAAAKPPRINSMDQFRGYTVAGMFLVNFMGGFAAIHHLLKHNDQGYFTYADSIMPSFIFCAGFSYRLTALRRFAEIGSLAATWSYFRRSLALVMVSVVMYTFNVEPKDVGNLTGFAAFMEFLFRFLKSGMWEVLSVIGVTQILLLPVINKSFFVRLLTLFGIMILHVLLAWSFNYNFSWGQASWFDSIFGAHFVRPWDGGLFGPVGWAVPMLVGTLTYDVIAKRTPQYAWGILLLASLLLMAGGYLTNSLTRFYDVTPESQALTEQVRADLQKQLDDARNIQDPDQKRYQVKAIESRLKFLNNHAYDPVIPSPERLKNAKFGWAELPFVIPPGPDKRLENYWMMNKKRTVALPFTLFSSGFALFLYSLSIPLCDLGGLQIGVFRTFGQNPLAAYIIAHMTEHSILSLTDRNSSLNWILFCFGLFFLITYLMLRYLEKHKLFLRL